MGGVIGGIVGGIASNRASKRQAAATREATAAAQQQVAPFRQAGIQAQNALLGALGLQGGDAANMAFRQFLDSTGFQNELQAGSQAITGNAAARGLLDSGATARALQGFGQNLAQSRFQNFLGQLGGIANTGAGAAAQSAGLIQQGGQLAGMQRAQGALGFGNALSGAIGGLLPTINPGSINLFGGGGGMVAPSGSLPLGIPPIDLGPAPTGPDFGF